MNTLYRKELKYIIPVSEFRSLKGKISAYLKPDENMKNGFYRVRSLYFDTLGDDDLMDSVYGHMEKSKLRIRVYPPQFGKITLELKEKSGYDGAKTQVAITRAESYELMKSRYNFLLENGSESALKIYKKLSGSAYVPTSVVQYDRAAYYLSAGDTRITFDCNMGFCRSSSAFFKNNMLLCPAPQKGLGVLEVKYNSVLLGAVKDILRDIDNLTEASSKYVESRLLL